MHAAGQKTCDTTELYLPDNAVEWQCEDANNNLVQTGNDCKLICQAGYSEAICKFFQILAKIRLIVAWILRCNNCVDISSRGFSCG